MDFLTHNNKFVDGQLDKHLSKYDAKGKNVIVIGGGDTGSDCIGTSNRHGAKNVINFELASKPSRERDSKKSMALLAIYIKIIFFSRGRSRKGMEYFNKEVYWR